MEKEEHEGGEGGGGGMHLLVADLEEESAAPPIALHAEHLRVSRLSAERRFLPGDLRNLFC